LPAGFAAWGFGLLPKNARSWPQKPRTSLPMATTSSAVLLISTKDSLACLYSSHPAWICLTKPAASRQMLIGSTSQLEHQRQEHADDGCAAADQDLLNALEPSIDAVVAELADLFVRIKPSFNWCHVVTSSAGNGVLPSASARSVVHP